MDNDERDWRGAANRGRTLFLLKALVEEKEERVKAYAETVDEDASVDTTAMDRTLMVD